MAGMTRYSVDSDVRSKAVLAIGGISLVAAIALNVVLMPFVESGFRAAGLGTLYSSLNMAGILSGAGTLGLYGLLWKWFDARLWKCRLLGGVHGIPDLNGVWEGEGVSNFKINGECVRYDMKLEVTQTFSKIECKSKFEKSQSTNHIVGIHGCNPKRRSCILEFSYRNEAGEEAVKDAGWDGQHRGFNWIECEGDEMVGHYFTNREIPTSGTFTLTRIAGPS